MKNVFGVAGKIGAMELYGVNASWEVTVHGWFNQFTGYSLLSGRPPCVIAVDDDTLSPDMIASLRECGHEVIIMPASGRSSQNRRRRSAKDVCRLAMGFATAPSARWDYATVH